MAACSRAKNPHRHCRRLPMWWAYWNSSPRSLGSLRDLSVYSTKQLYTKLTISSTENGSVLEIASGIWRGGPNLHEDVSDIWWALQGHKADSVRSLKCSVIEDTKSKTPGMHPGILGLVSLRWFGSSDSEARCLAIPLLNGIGPT